MAVEIRLDKLRREFGQTIAVDSITETFTAQSVTCLLGPSGCGKTTLMRMIAGLQEPSSGDIYFGDTCVTEMTPSERNIGMVFQYPVVYRGISLFENIELPLKREKGLSKKDRQARVQNVLETLDLMPYAKTDVMSLSNALKQKAAVARAVARQPQIILFDEPITNVDANAKVQLKRALKSLVRQHSQTIVYVTHDQTEAMTLADEIALMDAGRIIQRGRPRDIYNNPNNRFGGWFLGNPGMNFIKQKVEHVDGSFRLSSSLFRSPIAVSGLPDDSDVTLGIRPERVRLGVETATSVKGEVVHTALVVGGQTLASVQVGDVMVKIKVPHDQPVEEGMTVDVDCLLDYVALFAENGEGLEFQIQSG